MFEKISAIICDQLGLEPEKVTKESKFIDDLGCDSLDIVEMTYAVQDEFSLTDIPEDALTKIQTVGDLVTYVEEHAANKE